MPAIRVAVMGGDGVGPEVTAESVRVLEAAVQSGLVEAEVSQFPQGADHFLATGETLSDRTFSRLRDDYDAILFGAVGDPRIPDGRHARDILLGLRFRLDLFINLRPLRLRAPDLCPLKRLPPEPIDFVIFRENTEGLYGGHGRLEREGEPDERAVSEAIATRPAVERIIRAAFEHARELPERRRLVTLGDKANAVPHVYGLWRRVFAEVSGAFPDVRTETRYVDALAMEMVRAPHRYGVIVTENLLGDILSDLGAELVGGPGLAPSANLHPGRPGLYEPVHGRAPDIAGSGRANPMASILSLALLLRDRGAPRAAAAVEDAVDLALVRDIRTPDLGGGATTGQVGEWIAEAVRASADATR